MSKAAELEKPAPSTDKPLSLYEKLAKIVEEVTSVEMKGKNTFDDYNYIRAVDLMALIRKQFVANRLFMSTSVADTETWNNEAGKRKNGITVITEHTIFDLDSGLSFVFRSAGQGVDSGDKAVYKALTGAVKYAIRNLFLIPDPSADPEADPQGSAPDDSGPKEIPAAQPEGDGGKAKRGRKADKAKAEETAQQAVDRKRLFAILRSKMPEVSEDDVRAAMADALKKFGWSSTADVTAAKYEQFCEYLQEEKK